MLYKQNIINVNKSNLVFNLDNIQYYVYYQIKITRKNGG